MLESAVLAVKLVPGAPFRLDVFPPTAEVESGGSLELQTVLKDRGGNEVEASGSISVEELSRVQVRLKQMQSKLERLQPGPGKPPKSGN